MKTVRLILSFAGFQLVSTLLSAFASYDNRERTLWPDLVIGALVGLFFGLVFGGLHWRWLDAIFGPEEAGEEKASEET